MSLRAWALRPLSSCLEASLLLFAFGTRCRTLSSSCTMPGCCHAPALMIMDLTSEPVSQPELNVVLIRVALVMVSVHSSKTLTKTLSLDEIRRWSP